MSDMSAFDASPAAPRQPASAADALKSFDDPEVVGTSVVATTLTRFSDDHGNTASESSVELALSSAVVPAAPSVHTALVPRAASHEFSGHVGEWLNSSKLKAVTGAARIGPLDRPSMLNALAFKCKGAECTEGQCSQQLDELNVFHLRQRWSVECTSFGFDGSSREPLFKTLSSHYDRSRKTFSKPRVRIVARSGLEKDVDLCIATWAVCVANAGWSTFEKARSDVTQHREQKDSSMGPGLPTKRLHMTIDQAGSADEASLGGKEATFFRLVKSYVKELAQTLEHSPAPGAQRRTIEYLAPRETWEKRAKDCELHFAARGHHVSVDRRLLKKAWQSLATLVDKTMKAHSKCDVCAYQDAQLAGLIGRPDKEAVILREKLRESARAHRRLMAVERSELDDAGYRSFLYPLLQMTFIADGATQRNFRLPKLRHRLPKELAHKNLFNCKLYGVFLYGYGMTCYVIHESVGGGANLACTCLYLSLMDALKSGRPLPEEIHFQLDNTTSENKCITMICFAAWLVQNKWVTRVRIFFLVKGHTHVVIDQCFGAITTALRSNSVYTFPELLDCIHRVISESSTYQGKKVQRLHHLFDFYNFFDKAHTGIKGFATSSFNYDGYHDFVVTLNDENKAVLNVKRMGSTPDFEEALGDGLPIFKDGAFDNLAPCPPMCDIEGDEAWDRNEFSATYRAYEQYFGVGEEKKNEIRQAWTDTMADTASSTSSLLAKNTLPFPLPNLDEAQPEVRKITLGRQNLDHLVDVSNPPVCTIHGGGRSQSQVRKEVDAWLVQQRGNQPVATMPGCAFALYAKDWVLVDNGSALPKLMCISRRLQGHLPPNSVTVDVTCVAYTRPSESDVGFFGPYTRPVGKIESHTISRAEILVYNVTFLKVKGKKAVRYLSEETLTAVSDVLPEFAERLQQSKPSDVYNQRPGSDNKDRRVGAIRQRKQPVRHRPESEEDEDDDDSAAEEEPEEDPFDGEDDWHEPFCDDNDESPGADESDQSEFILRGERKKGDYVWVDLEDSQNPAKISPPIGLGICTTDQNANGKVYIDWFGPYQWKGRGEAQRKLTVTNSRFAFFWDNVAGAADTGGYVRSSSEISVSSILPIRVELSYGPKGEVIRLTPDSVDAVTSWCQKNTTSRPDKRRR